MEKILNQYGIISKEQAFCRAAWSGDIENMKYLIENEQVDFNTQDQNKGMAALHCAVIRKDKIAIQWLLQVGVNTNIGDVLGSRKFS